MPRAGQEHALRLQRLRENDPGLDGADLPGSKWAQWSSSWPWRRSVPVSQVSAAKIRHPPTSRPCSLRTWTGASSSVSRARLSVKVSAMRNSISPRGTPS
jgi:hypothetical protein